MKKYLVCLSLFLFASIIHADVQLTPVVYKDGQTELEGVLVRDTANVMARPGVLIVHQWMGITDYEKGRAKQLAGLGYTVFLADIYGKGKSPSTMQEAGALAGQFKKDRVLMRKRANLALETFQKSKFVKPGQIDAIGYCFGGTVVLELARSGAAVKGVVSFHGGLDTPNPKDASAIKGSVLVLHGADDPYVSWDEVSAFRKEMQDAKVDWQFNAYGNAVHAFSQKMAGDDPSKGAAYNALADERSFEELKSFLSKTLGK